MPRMEVLFKKQLHPITFSSRAKAESRRLSDGFNFTCRLSTVVVLDVG